jgi:hypothetical protein
MCCNRAKMNILEDPEDVYKNSLRRLQSVQERIDIVTVQRCVDVHEFIRQGAYLSCNHTVT